MEFEKVIDVHPNFPSHQYDIAMYELYDRYLLPRLEKIFKQVKGSDTEALGISKKNEGQGWSTRFADFISYSKKQNISLMVYLHAERDELKAGRYNEEGQ